MNEAQIMWHNIFLSILKTENLNHNIGDFPYVFKNAIAKYVSSSDYYYITKGAASFARDNGINLDAPVNVSKYFYGLKCPTILEHTIPVSVIFSAIIERMEDTPEVKRILENCGGVTIMLRSEDDLLRTAGLRSRMPAAWRDFGDDPFMRYQSVGIELCAKQVRRIGPIRR